jgi:putative oxidoreductase
MRRFLSCLQAQARRSFRAAHSMSTSLNVALLTLRVVGGLTLAGHGAQKLFGWFGGPGRTRFGQGLQAQGFRPLWLWLGLVILGEVGGGLSLAFGLLTPLGAAGAVGAMFMAIAKAHWKNGFWNSKRGIEFPLQLLAIGAALGIAGPGDYSLDKLFTPHLPEAALFLALAAAALVVDVIGLAISRTPAPVPAQVAPGTPGTPGTPSSAANS